MAQRATYARLTEFLRGSTRDVVTVAWDELDEVVGGLPASAVNHYPQWWHGDRSHTRAWRRAGYELESVSPEHSVTFRRKGEPDDPQGRGSVRSSPSAASRSSTELPPLDPRSALLVIACSSAKAPGGRHLAEFGGDTGWPRELIEARARVLAQAGADDGRFLPAWQRYTGHFYKHAEPALAEAVASGRVLIISGGYGLVRADEPIAYYNRRLQLADWPRGLLERALLAEARRVGARSVVGFLATSSDYARLFRRVDWRVSGAQVVLATIEGVQGGAQARVPRALGQAFSASWRQEPGDQPAGLTWEPLT
ncbi:hypothetical protein GCM10009603_08960 [Nocardiopsis exhalans]